MLVYRKINLNSVHFSYFPFIRNNYIDFLIRGTQTKITYLFLDNAYISISVRVNSVKSSTIYL